MKGWIANPTNAAWCISEGTGDFSDWAVRDIDWLDVAVSGAAGGLTFGLDKVYKAGKIGGGLYKAGRAANIFLTPAISSGFDWTPFAEGDGSKFEVNTGKEFWAPYLYDVVTTGISAKTGNEIVDGLYGDKPWILNDPLKGDLWKDILEIPVAVWAGRQSDKILEEKPIQNTPTVPNIPSPYLPPSDFNPQNRSTEKEEGSIDPSIYNLY